MQVTREAAFLPREGVDGPSLIEWMTMPQEQFSARFKGSPINRAKRRGLLRNIPVALGDWESPDSPTAASQVLGRLAKAWVFLVRHASRSRSTPFSRSWRNVWGHSGAGK